ncbi:hypothetical protein Patl1_36723 [Pistacia atlantica]|nr:hypothetical protein Patl1_36723 [Pistacia atlantica]
MRSPKKSQSSDIPGTTLMHKEHFLDHTKQVMIKIVQE